ncbi:MAG: ParB/RepB/Spo0J family partition protein [Actinobacteria bacterium]|nr:ParB/RepB/Spo0J family partition protein [Actinomycetota bacterium]
MSGPEVPRGVRAAILRSVAQSRYPREALASVASNHNLTLAQVKGVVEQHGWPLPQSMLKAAALLERAGVRETEDSGQEDIFLVIEIGRLCADPDNVRDDLGDLGELMDSMVQVGLLQPIVARRQSGRLVVLAGHRRLAAAHRLGWTEVPCLIKAGVHPDDVLSAMLVENGQRKDLDPLEEARGLRHLKDRGSLTDMQVGLKVGRSQPYVSGRLALLELSPADQAAIRAGTMTLQAGATAGRRKGGHHRPGAEGKKSAAHLTGHHPLAAAVVDLCQVQLGHHKNTPGRVGGIACGHCWEAVIRADERAVLVGEAPE